MVPNDPLTGRQIANYRIERLLGRGGMASVYFGVDVQLQRPAALKVIDDRFRHDPAFSERFLRESRAMAAWRHPNIPQIYQAGVEDGINFYAMEYIHGMDLEKLLIVFSEKREVLTYEDVLQIGRAVANALDYAHGKGAVHRDVKTANVMISDDDRILLTDFGLILEVSKGTRGEVFGSPHYIAPEQARNSAEAVPQSDLYSLGVILYEMLVGSLPFDDDSPASLALKHITEDPPSPSQVNPGLGPEIEAVLLKALKKLPEERYRTGEELMDTLEKAIQAQQIREDTNQSLTLLPSELASKSEQQITRPRPTVSQLSAAAIVARDLGSQPKTLASLDSTPPPPTEAVLPSKKEGPAALFRNKIPFLGSCSFAVIISICIFIGFGSAIAARWFGVFQDKPSQTPQSTAALIARGQPTESTNSPARHTSTATGEPGLRTHTQTRPPPSGTFTPTPTSTPSPTPTSTLSPSPTSTFTPSPTRTLTPTPSATPFTEYHLLFAKQKDEGLFIVNKGESILPLPLLELRKGRFKLLGEEWEIEVIKPGECLTAWKTDGRVKLPKELECKLVGKLLRFNPRDIFWTSDFDIYYNDSLVDTCKKNKVCDFKFRSAP